MESWANALATLGGFAAIGGLIDLAMYKSEKDKLKARLEDWWLRFGDLKWSNFGRAEAELAVQILDRWAGPRLWTWKRWWFATKCVLLVFAATSLWLALLTLIAGNWPYLSGEFDRIVLGTYIVPSSIVAFAASLSLTRYIAVVAAKLSKSRTSCIVTFALLLVIHVTLLLYWSVVVTLAMVAPVWVILDVTSGTNFLSVDRAKDLMFDSYRNGPFGIPLPDWSALFTGQHSVQQETNLSAFKAAMDIVANGLRIVFALVFLSSFVFRPLIQGPISRLWYGAINSDKPVFTRLFGAIGATIAAAIAVLSK